MGSKNNVGGLYLKRKTFTKQKFHFAFILSISCIVKEQFNNNAIKYIYIYIFFFIVFIYLLNSLIYFILF